MLSRQREKLPCIACRHLHHFALAVGNAAAAAGASKWRQIGIASGDDDLVHVYPQRLAAI